MLDLKPGKHQVFLGSEKMISLFKLKGNYISLKRVKHSAL